MVHFSQFRKCTLYMCGSHRGSTDRGDAADLAWNLTGRLLHSFISHKIFRKSKWEVWCGALSHSSKIVPAISHAYEAVVGLSPNTFSGGRPLVHSVSKLFGFIPGTRCNVVLDPSPWTLLMFSRRAFTQLCKCFLWNNAFAQRITLHAVSENSPAKISSANIVFEEES